MRNNLELFEKGWTELEGISSAEDLLRIARSLGDITPHPNGDYLEIVTPKDGENLMKGTFSQRYGYSSFPLHTDTAFWPRPARYLVLGMLAKSECDTFILSVRSIINSLSKASLKSLSNVHEIS